MFISPIKVHRGIEEVEDKDHRSRAICYLYFLNTSQVHGSSYIMAWYLTRLLASEGRQHIESHVLVIIDLARFIL